MEGISQVGKVVLDSMIWSRTKQNHLKENHIIFNLKVTGRRDYRNNPLLEIPKTISDTTVVPVHVDQEYDELHVWWGGSPSELSSEWWFQQWAHHFAVTQASAVMPSLQPFCLLQHSPKYSEPKIWSISETIGETVLTKRGPPFQFSEPKQTNYV